MGFLLDNEDMDILQGKKNIKQNKKVAQKETVVFEEEKQIKIDYSDIIPEDEKIQINRTIKLDGEKYMDFTQEKYPYSLNFYDFEVFVHDWCITIINPVQKIMRVLTNDKKALKRYYSQHKKEIWVGYNSRNYDTFIMKGLLLGMNPKEVNDDIIVRGLKGWQINKKFKSIPFFIRSVLLPSSVSAVSAESRKYQPEPGPGPCIPLSCLTVF